MKLSKSQLFWMVFISEIVLLTYFAFGPSLKQAKQDIWIAYLLAGAGAVIGSYLMVKVSMAYPNQTMVQYIQIILGKWLGKVVALAYICFWLLIIMIMLRGTVDFIGTNLLYQTPALVIIVFEILLMLYFNLQGGITTIGRCSQVIGPLLFVAAFLPMMLNSTHMDYNQLLPVYNEGSKGIVNGAAIIFCFIGETSIVMMVTAFVKESKSASSGVLSAVGFGTLWGCMMSVAVILLFGAVSAADMYHPHFMFMKSISILDFIQNFDLVITFFLQFGIMIKLASHLFISSYGIAQWMNFRNWKRVTWVLAFLILIGMLTTSNLSFEYLIQPWFFLLFNFALPVLVWIIHLVKRAAV
ncbi:endospore germination permease [Paenibacillus sp. BC26]|uniref:GerAB/ArcD/ProY family transporter n=1 Tax=Paenibacillus sp. BC26 TaxID=1881032 RepID=UPI0008EC1B69|nr:endospore germination permease [Paenibacillus sp. BC26]SFS60574.1 spore germination protein KB [Paenibacillus sp. BC26]